MEEKMLAFLSDKPDGAAPREMYEALRIQAGNQVYAVGVLMGLREKNQVVRTEAKVNGERIVKYYHIDHAPAG